MALSLAYQNAGSTALMDEKFDQMTLMAFAAYEQPLKWIAFALGLGSAVSVVQGWQLLAMSLSLPFCLIWIYCGWLRTERQLKLINVLFACLYVYGIARYFIVQA